MPETVTYVQSLCGALRAAMDEDASIVVLAEDLLDPYGGAFKVTRGLSTQFPERVFATPICEATIVGITVGLALRGRRPVAEIMFGDFITLALDQLVNHAAKFRAMYNGQVSLPLVVRSPMGGHRGYGPTHSQSLERLFFGIPHLVVVSPSHVHRAGDMLRTAIRDPEPVLFIENKLLYPQPLDLKLNAFGLRREELSDPFGYPSVVLRNHAPGVKPDVTVVAYGGSSALLVPALARLAEEEVWVLACLPGRLSPLPVETLIACASESKRLVVVEEGYADFGWGAEVAACLAAALHGELFAPVQRLGACQAVIPATRSLEEEVLVSREKIESAILEVIAW